MSKGVEIGNIVKRSISLSPQVNQWAEEMAEEMAAAKGYQNNFSAFLADLIREARGDATPATRDDKAILLAEIKKAAGRVKGRKAAKA